MHSSQIHCKLDIQQNTFSITTLDGYEALSTPFSFNLTFQAPSTWDESAILGKTASLCFINNKTVLREITGIIERTEIKESVSTDKNNVCVILSSRLHLLKNYKKPHIILSKTVIEIAQDLLTNQAGYLTCHIKCHFKRQYPIEPFTMQVPEEDAFDFLHRLLAKAGIFYYFENDSIVLNDNNQALPLIKYSFSNANIFNIQISKRKVADRYIIRDYNENIPELIKASEQINSAQESACLEIDLFGLGARNETQAQRLAKVYALRARVESFLLKAKTHHAEIFAGSIINIELNSLNNTRYLITRIRHSFNKSTNGYSNRVSTIKATTQFQARIPSKPFVPICFTARIESTGVTALLDESGRYRVRYGFDSSTKPLAEASIPLRKLDCYGGRQSSIDNRFGWHCPLLNGTAILAGSFNGNPDKPFIIGSYGESVVTRNNPNQNCFNTASGNKLIMADNIQQHAIALETPDSDNSLILKNNTELTSKNGDINLYAHENCMLKTDNNLIETINETCEHSIMNDHTTKTEQGDLTFYAKNNIGLISAKQIDCQSNKQICFNADHDINLLAHNTLKLTGSELSFQSQFGRIIMKSNKRIKIECAAPIHIASKNAGIVLIPTGLITVYGNTITGNIIYNGAVNRQNSPMKFPEIDTTITWW